MPELRPVGMPEPDPLDRLGYTGTLVVNPVTGRPAGYVDVRPGDAVLRPPAEHVGLLRLPRTVA
jgi:hypothetical protein